MYRRNPPTWVYAFLAALVGGILISQGHLVGGGVLIVLAIVLKVGWDLTVSDGDDHSGLY